MIAINNKLLSFSPLLCCNDFGVGPDRTHLHGGKPMIRSGLGEAHEGSSTIDQPSMLNGNSMPCGKKCLYSKASNIERLKSRCESRVRKRSSRNGTRFALHRSKAYWRGKCQRKDDVYYPNRIYAGICSRLWALHRNLMTLT